MRDELIIRQHYNELFDCVLCALKIREKVKGSSQLIWTDIDQLKFDNDGKVLITEIRDSIALIYPEWKIYIENLEKVISRFGTVVNKNRIFDKEYHSPVKTELIEAAVPELVLEEKLDNEKLELDNNNDGEKGKPKEAATAIESKPVEESSESKPTTNENNKPENPDDVKDETKPPQEEEEPVVKEEEEEDGDNAEAIQKEVQPLRRSVMPYGNDMHPTLKFYSGNYTEESGDDESLDIEKYFSASGNKLMNKILSQIEIVFPFVNEGDPVFAESDKEKLINDIVLRQNYNRLVDEVMVEMGIRDKRKSSQLKWTEKDLAKMSGKMITILKRMKKSIEDIFPSWIIYIQVLNKLLGN